MTRSRADPATGVPTDLVPVYNAQRAGAEFNAPDRAAFYAPGPKGYIDYPALEPSSA